MNTKGKEARREYAIKQLRKIVKPGDTLRTIIRHVSRSGTSRSISVVKINRRGEVRDLDVWVSHALEMRIDERHGGLKIDGCGMDMGFELVYRLSDALYGYGSAKGYKCLGERCPSNSHVNDRNAPSGPDVRHRDGYAVSQRWL